MAAREVDTKNTANLRVQTVRALTDAGLPCERLDDVIKVSPGWDLKIWLSLNTEAGSGDHTRHELAARIVAALTSGGLHLVSEREPQSNDAAERLVRGEALCVEVDGAAVDQAST
jgi:hypothetical protein